MSQFNEYSQPVEQSHATPPPPPPGMPMGQQPQPNPYMMQPNQPQQPMGAPAPGVMPGGYPMAPQATGGSVTDPAFWPSKLKLIAIIVFVGCCVAALYNLISGIIIYFDGDPYYRQASTIFDAFFSLFHWLIRGVALTALIMSASHLITLVKNKAAN